MSNDLTPILVGAGQVTEKGVDPLEAMGPIDLMAEAAWRAADDAGIEREIIIGRLKDGKRFLANTPQDRTLLENLTVFDPLGLKGHIQQQRELNIFSPE